MKNDVSVLKKKEAGTLKNRTREKFVRRSNELDCEVDDSISITMA